MTNTNAPTTSDNDQNIQHVLLLVHQVAQYADDMFRNNVSLSHLTPRQYILLQTIQQNPGISQTGLVVRTGVDRSTIADIIKRLQSKKLVHRTRNRRDARMYVLRLTEQGRQTVIDARASADEAVKSFLKPLPKSQQAEFISSLASIAATFKISRDLE